jgi:hypothetical protein
MYVPCLGDTWSNVVTVVGTLLSERLPTIAAGDRTHGRTPIVVSVHAGLPNDRSIRL